MNNYHKMAEGASSEEDHQYYLRKAVGEDRRLATKAARKAAGVDLEARALQTVLAEVRHLQVNATKLDLSELRARLRLLPMGPLLDRYGLRSIADEG